ncbi:Hsp33 family molecular chaperone HslO [Arsenophonus endosymbiont of Bemisia tabaci]|uniref:Hsp33 family molecular chaperone HslO n=1 Tax=Arsenophonus endosymbiont of Bemisia tabaci TaxID=536059 RepID=UPI001750D12F|nr:Hsp33 family molecular chaperone HslO [Arsenophonus endosymbiont of Bemisia tabaci]CAA2931139.1 33 kDa chaperonin [Arsenophonus endosymbiont of Bemisia tabaci Q2]
MGELLVSTSLLTATLKFEGDITIQIQRDSPVKMLVINENNHQQMRGVACIEGSVTAQLSLKQMVGQGYMVITITPTNGERYQGVVALAGNTIAEYLDDYFKQSEQLQTRLFIRSGEINGEPAAGGILLRVLPSAGIESQHQFDHLVQLTATIKGEELFTLEPKEILHRLYHEEDVTLYDPQLVAFHCSCSKSVVKIFCYLFLMKRFSIYCMNERGEIDIECEFCAALYLFNKQDIEELKRIKKQ